MKSGQKLGEVPLHLLLRGASGDREEPGRKALQSASQGQRHLLQGVSGPHADDWIRGGEATNQCRE